MNMSNADQVRVTRGPGFLTRLARDVRGNTMAIMGAALIPLAGMVGGGVDIARMYLIDGKPKKRSGQECHNEYINRQ